MKINVKDVIGPLPCDNHCYIILNADGKTLPLKCGYSDAETCHSLLGGEGNESGYEFFSNTLNTLNINLKSVELDAVGGTTYAKIFLSSPYQEKMLRISSSNACAGINAALAASCAIEGTDAFVSSIADVTSEYHSAVRELGRLWPIPSLDKTEAMMVVSDFLDKAESKNDQA